MRQQRSPASISAIRLRPIGVIRSPLTSRKNAPRQGSEGAPDAWLEIKPWAMPALHRLAVGDEVFVITWFHRARRDVMQVRPRSDPRNPITGVFATRSGNRLRIGPIEAIDGTPVVDIKPVLKF
jgi:tRNA (Thr-GGU) A37 N-methylase